MKRNQAGQYLSFALLNSQSGLPLTGASGTVSVRRNLDGVESAAVGTVTEPNSDGKYLFAPTQADTDGASCSYYFTAPGAIPVCLNVHTDSHGTAPGAVKFSDYVRSGTSNTPIAGVDVWATAGEIVIAATKTDAFGYFELWLDPGTYTLHVQLAGWNSVSQTINVSG